MSNVVYFIATGLVAAAAALFIWYNQDSNQNKPQQVRKSPSKSTNGSVSVKDTDEKCIICMDRYAAVKFVPCLHSCMCAECYPIYKKYDNKCPLCRFAIERLLPVKS